MLLRTMLDTFVPCSKHKSFWPFKIFRPCLVPPQTQNILDFGPAFWEMDLNTTLDFFGKDTHSEFWILESRGQNKPKLAHLAHCPLAHSPLARTFLPDSAREPPLGTGATAATLSPRVHGSCRRRSPTLGHCRSPNPTPTLGRRCSPPLVQSPNPTLPPPQQHRSHHRHLFLPAAQEPPPLSHRHLSSLDLPSPPRFRFRACRMDGYNGDVFFHGDDDGHGDGHSYGSIDATRDFLSQPLPTAGSYQGYSQAFFTGPGSSHFASPRTSMAALDLNS